MWSATVPPGRTDLTFQAGWAPDFTARISYSMLDNVVDRVVPDAEAREFFVAHGLPQADELTGPEAHWRVLGEPHFAAVRAWIESSSRRTWMLWLLRHPWQRVADQWEHGWQLLGIANDEHVQYMPEGWRGHAMLPKTRGVTGNHVIVAIALLLAPFAAYRVRRERAAIVVWVQLPVAWLASLAALYGDSAEPGRHCYGAGQQFLLALYFLFLTALDRSDDPATACHHMQDEQGAGEE